MKSLSYKSPIYFFLVVIVSSLLVCYFYGNILKSSNYVFFAKGGDGLKSTYGSYYHLKYDSTYSHTVSQNYPYGESVYYTGSQPLIINTLKFLGNFGFDFSDNLISILNVWMILSLVIGLVFMYLLLSKLSLPPFYSFLVSAIVIFLSPQLDRFGGHYNLAYLYFFPAMLYLLLLFYQSPSCLKSVIIGLLSFVSLVTHAYLFAFWGLWILFFLLVLFFIKKGKFGRVTFLLVSYIIQIVLPFVVFYFLSTDDVTDRTAYPWGFPYNTSHPEGVFLPIGKPYGKFFHFDYLKWEGMAYIGLVATIGFLTLLYTYFKRFNWKNRKQVWLHVTGNDFLDAVFWGAFIALLFSFAYPFAFGFWEVWNYMGPLRQFRAVGRFNWLFYYTINISVFYLLWKWNSERKSILSKVLIFLAIGWGGYDAYLNVHNRGEQMENRKPLIEDVNNEMVENEWVNKVDVNEFQAVLPLPYYHLGSEVYWIPVCEGVMESTFLISWKTGLPQMSVLLSRTSISQTMKSLELKFEPINPFRILKDLPNKKDILLINNDNCSLNENEARIMKYSSPIFSFTNFSLYRLTIDSLTKLQKDFVLAEKNKNREEILYFKQGYNVSDSLGRFIFKSNHGNSDFNFDNEDMMEYDVRDWNTVLDTTMYKSDTLNCFSFWMDDLNKDLIPRSKFQLIVTDSVGKSKDYIEVEVFRFVKFVNPDGSGLVEFNFTPTQKGDKLRFLIHNNLVTGGKLRINNLLIRPASSNIYKEKENYFVKNNRFFAK